MNSLCMILGKNGIKFFLFSLIVIILFVSQPSQAILTLSNSMGANSPSTHKTLVARTILELSDLPPRFQVAPTFLQEFLQEGIAAVKPYLDKEGIKIEETSAFVDFAPADLVMGLAFALLNQESVNKFDASLRRQDALEQFIRVIKDSLEGLGELKLIKSRNLPLPKDLGNIARGFGFQAKFQELPLSLFVEAIAFRRHQSGVLLIVGSLNHGIQGIQVQDLATSIDRHLLYE